MVLICYLCVVFYVSHTGNVCFPIGKRTFPHWKTYVSASGDIKYNRRLFYYRLCLFKFAISPDKEENYNLIIYLWKLELAFFQVFNDGTGKYLAVTLSCFHTLMAQ